jgi:hypothetical protein
VLKRSAIEGREYHKKRKLESDKTKEGKKDEEENIEGGSVSKLIEIDEEKTCHKSMDRSEKHNKEMLAVVQASTAAIKSLHKAIIQLLENKK